MEMMQRIRALMEQRDVNQDALARIAGVSKGSVSHWFAGRVSPKAEPLSRIADYFGVSVEYLLTGESVGVRPSPVRMVPILGTTFAGVPDEPIECGGEAMLYDSLAERHPRCYALRVHGSCMDRVFTESDHIFVDPDRQPRDGSIAVMLIDGKTETRRVKLGAGTMLLVSESHEPQPDIVIMAGDGREVTCQGTVFWWQSAVELP